MIDKGEKYTNCFDSVCEYAVWRGVFRQRCSIELSVQSETEREQATSIHELSVRYASSIDEQARSILWWTRWFDFVIAEFSLVRYAGSIDEHEFCGEHAGSISCVEHWIWTLGLL